MSLMPSLLGAGSGGGGGGDPGDSATLPANDFLTQGFSGTAYSGVKFDNDGNVYERQYSGAWSNVGSWLMSGTNSDFFIKRTINSNSLTTDAGAGPLVLSSDRIYDVQRTTDGEKEASISFSIVNSGETVVYASATYSFFTIRGLV